MYNDILNLACSFHKLAQQLLESPEEELLFKTNAIQDAASTSGEDLAIFIRDNLDFQSIYNIFYSLNWDWACLALLSRKIKDRTLHIILMELGDQFTTAKEHGLAGEYKKEFISSFKKKMNEINQYSVS